MQAMRKGKRKNQKNQVLKTIFDNLAIKFYYCDDI